MATSDGDIVVIGCGNLLRGDDAVGPTLVRQLWDEGVPRTGVVLVDGGTAGMDVAFKMRGARRVIIVDASSSGSPPGTIFRVPADQLENTPPLEGLHSHSFRWDHALSLGRWLLGEEYPRDVTVFLIEAGDVSFGVPLSAPVAVAMARVAAMVRAAWETDAASYLPSDSLFVPARGGELLGAAKGGLRVGLSGPEGMNDDL
jgi:hydrogenase maturation protease